MNNMFEYKGFYGSVEYSLEDKCFHGKIMGIRDLVTFEGDNIQEFEKAFHEMTDDYILDLKKYESFINVILPPELHKEAAAVASKRGMSLNDFVKKAISDELSVNHKQY